MKQPYITLIIYEKLFPLYTKIIWVKLFHLPYLKTIPCQFILFKSSETPIDDMASHISTNIHKHLTDKSTQNKKKLYSLTNTRSFLLIQSNSF